MAQHRRWCAGADWKEAASGLSMSDSEVFSHVDWGPCGLGKTASKPTLSSGAGKGFLKRHRKKWP